MEIKRSFNGGAERYVYDCGECSVKNGFSQLDTSQDASYFGIWANPTTLQIVLFVEGDVTEEQADNAEEFVSAIRRLKTSYEEYGHRFFGIDPMGSKAMKEQWEKLGLGDLLH